MRKLLTVICVFAVVTLQAKQWSSEEVKEIIKKVNTYWQTNNPAEVRAFWDHAAYHTGNMEAIRLLSEVKSEEITVKSFLDYSLRWAQHNQWKGATEPDPGKWKYKRYGEGQDYVLFGDWQICFQTYIDLYNLAPQKKKVARAKEVMGYEADSKANDYWWWADALYMVMPVMTKMYKLTGEEKYLDKLYENICYSDSIMLDQETGLYFRDGKYVYPKHKTASGKKDFWARGDGWVLAGLAKVLQDMPKTYKHQPFFAEKFVNLAHGVKCLQQPEGHWTRSMMDPDQAPGYETSGTAFFCYGLLWVSTTAICPERSLNLSLRKHGTTCLPLHCSRTERLVMFSLSASAPYLGRRSILTVKPTLVWAHSCWQPANSIAICRLHPRPIVSIGARWPGRWHNPCWRTWPRVSCRRI